MPRPWRHLYGRRWRKLKTMHLARQPLCVFCEKEGRITPAQVVDHRKRHFGDALLFFDPNNLQSLCEHCHNSTKQRMERAEEDAPEPCGVDGYPINSDW